MAGKPKRIYMCRATFKGAALSCAIESGLLQTDADGNVELGKFNQFWSLFRPYVYDRYAKNMAVNTTLAIISFVIGCTALFINLNII